MHRLAGRKRLSALVPASQGTSPAQTRHDWLVSYSRAGAWRRPGEREEVPMPIVGGLDIHRKQITFDYLDTDTGAVQRGQIAQADRQHVAALLSSVAGPAVVWYAVG